jgi:transcriptional regulator with XRE-family HTH domain
MARKIEDLGPRIRTARAEKGWKQKNLAAEVDVEPITVSRWERGATTPDLDVLNLVAEATGKPLSYFVDGSADAPASSLDEVAARIDAAASRIAAESERIAETLEALRAELARLR